MTRLYTIDPEKPASVVHFDWLTLVFPLPDEIGRRGKTASEWVYAILEKLYISDLIFQPLEHGLYTYENAETAGNNSIIIAWSDKDKESTWMLQMSGAGVETLESILANHNEVIKDFIKKANQLDASYSRVDPCCNFFNYPKELSARYVGEEAKKGNLITKTRSVRIIRRFSSTGARNDLEAYQGVSEAYTTYIGKNPKQLRIYNKLAERSDKVNLRYQVKSWVRWEFQLNGTHAQTFMNSYVGRNYDLVQTWIDYLASGYRFIERVGHQAKRSRYPNATWYDDIIKNAKKKIIVRNERQKPTFERSAKWIDKQVLPTLSTMYYARLQKYVENGVTYADAEKLAFQKIKKDIESVAVNQDIDWKRVSAWVQEQKDEDLGKVERKKL